MGFHGQRKCEKGGVRSKGSGGHSQANRTGPAGWEGTEETSSSGPLSQQSADPLERHESGVCSQIMTLVTQDRHQELSWSLRSLL